ncbi:unnamed protein product [Dicrocoelium dendriticum]|nr:unnamed protein product [Dicrocoelium dendriticum]
MLTASIFCLLNSLLSVSSNYFSITVATDEWPYVDFMNHTLGGSVELYCGSHRSYFDPNSERNCKVYRWFYEPETKELTCVCNVSDVGNKDKRLLLKDNGARGILAISEERFTEFDKVSQGSFAYEMNIWTQADANETARLLFSTAPNNSLAAPSINCNKISNEHYLYACIFIHHYPDDVTWDYPEYWSGPVRYLKYITYNNEYTAVHVGGIYWPKKQTVENEKFHMDTVMKVEPWRMDICASFFEKIHENWSQQSKCRVEFIERAITNPPYTFARLNVLIPVYMAEAQMTYLTDLQLVNRLKKPEENCIFPVHIRRKSASYVPSHTVFYGKRLEVIVSFEKVRIVQFHQERNTDTIICNKLIYLSSNIIQACSNITRYGRSHIVASVLIGPTVGSVYEAELQLMLQLNSRNPGQCFYNVMLKEIPKVY